MSIYQAKLMDYFKNPRNRGELENADVTSEELNPSCGDSVQLFIALDNGKIEKASFLGKGCVISQAAASLFTEKLVGMNLEDAKALDAKFMTDLIGIELGPNRLQCALLPLVALQKA